MLEETIATTAVDRLRESGHSVEFLPNGLEFSFVIRTPDGALYSDTYANESGRSHAVNHVANRLLNQLNLTRHK